MKESKQILEYVIQIRNEIQRKRRIRRNIIISVSASAACICLAVFSLKTLIPDVKKPEVPIAEVTLSENISTAPTVPAESSVMAESAAGDKKTKPAVTEPKTSEKKDKSATVSSHTEQISEQNKPKSSNVAEKHPDKTVTSAVSSAISSITSEPAADPSKTSVKSAEEMYVLPSWNESEIFEKYISFNYKNNDFVTQCGKVPQNMTGEKLDEIKITGQDFQTLELHEADVTLFKIKNISADCAVAVQFKGDEYFYSYTSVSYFPASLGNMFDDTDFENNAVFKELYLKETQTPARSYYYELLMKILKESRNAVCISDDIDFSVKYDISVSIPVIGISDKSFGITEDGYIVTNIFEYQNAYYIGKEKLDQFISTIVFDDMQPAVIDFELGEEE